MGGGITIVVRPLRCEIYFNPLWESNFFLYPINIFCNLSIEEFKTILSNEGYIVFDSTELRDNVIDQVFATTSDSSIVLSYEVFKDKDSSYNDFEEWKLSMEEAKNSGQVDDLILDSNKIQARFDETYTILIVCEDAVITALGQPDSDENIALVDRTISALGF